MKTKFTFTHADGRVAQRISETRQYTHVVLGRFNTQAVRADFTSAAWKKSYGDTWKYYLRTLERPADDSADSQTQKWYEEIKKIVSDNGDEQTFIAASIASALHRLDKQYGPGLIGDEVVLQWSMNEGNAVKSMAQHKKSYVHVRVAPVDGN